MNIGTAQIIRADSRRLPLAQDSVDLIVTSPPYFALRSYRDGGEHYQGQIGAEPTPDDFVSSLLEVTRECMRVLKPAGSLWVNLGDKYSQRPGQYPNGNAGAGDGLVGGARSEKHINARRAGAYTAMQPKSLIGVPWRYALRCIDDLGLILRAEVIWSKPNGLPESVTDRVRRSHEQWFHFTLQPRYFSAVDEIREEHVAPDRQRGPSPGLRLGDAYSAMPRHTFSSKNNPLGKLPGSVWTIATEPLRVPAKLGIEHFAAFPTEWPKRIIQGWTEPGMTVLDPFGGTGTTAMVAKALGRHGISVDMSADYCRLAEWRANDRDQLAKVLGIEKTSQQPDDQLDLFGGIA